MGFGDEWGLVEVRGVVLLYGAGCVGAERVSRWECGVVWECGA